MFADQRLDLCKLNPSDTDAVRGQIVGKNFLISKEITFTELNIQLFITEKTHKATDPW